MAVLRSLERVLRIRSVQEDLALAQLEAETARLHEIEREATEAACQALTSRKRWFAVIEQERLAGSELESSRTAEESVWELAIWRRERAESRQQVQRVEAERSRTGYFDRRRDRMQVQSLVAAGRSLEHRREERAEQCRLDDWFQSRQRNKFELEETTEMNM